MTDATEVQTAIAPVGASVIAEVSSVLSDLRYDIRMINSGMLATEAVHGVRILEPRNDLSQLLRELSWCVARLNGLTTLPPPKGDRLIEERASPHPRETDRTDPQGGLGHP